MPLIGAFIGAPRIKRRPPGLANGVLAFRCYPARMTDKDARILSINLVAQVVGIPLAVLEGLFFWIGKQTFNLKAEHDLAVVMYYYCITLVVISIGSFVFKKLRMSNIILTAGAVSLFLFGSACVLLPLFLAPLR